MKNWHYWEKRLTSYQFLMALSSLFMLILTNVFKIQVIPEQYQEIINALLYVLVLGGVVSDYPFIDKKTSYPPNDEKEE